MLCPSFRPWGAGSVKFFLTDRALSVEAAYKAVTREDCGAICLFTGNVRDHNDGKKVLKINYTAYAEMAEKEFRKIGEEMKKKWEIGDVYIAHRTGTYAPPEISVIVAVSAPHRQHAFEACRYAIDTLKKTAPIWKEEFNEEGKAWISG